MRVVLPLVCVTALGCGTAEGPGPKRPLPVDEALHAASPVLLEDDAELERWVAERLDRVRAGVAERVRVPLAARPMFSGEGSPYGLAARLPFSEKRAVRVRDLTSVGIQVGPDGWLGWVEGRFVDEAGEVVLEVLKQESRRPDEAAVYRVVSPR